MSDKTFDGLVEAIVQANDPPQTDGCNEAVARAAIAYLASVDVETDAYQLAQRLTQLDGSHGTMGAVPFEALHEQLATLCAALAATRAELAEMHAALATSTAEVYRVVQERDEARAELATERNMGAQLRNVAVERLKERDEALAELAEAQQDLDSAEEAIATIRTALGLRDGDSGTAAERSRGLLRERDEAGDIIDAQADALNIVMRERDEALAELKSTREMAYNDGDRLDAALAAIRRVEALRDGWQRSCTDGSMQVDELNAALRGEEGGS